MICTLVQTFENRYKILEYMLIWRSIDITSGNISKLKFLPFCLALQPLTVALATIGKMGSAAGFAVVYILSVELYPTVVRNAALGFGSAFARIGSMMAPYCAAVVRTVTII